MGWVTRTLCGEWDATCQYSNSILYTSCEVKKSSPPTFQAVVDFKPNEKIQKKLLPLCPFRSRNGLFFPDLKFPHLINEALRFLAFSCILPPLSLSLHTHTHTLLFVSRLLQNVAHFRSGNVLPYLCDGY